MVQGRDQGAGHPGVVAPTVGNPEFPAQASFPL